jgi:hypothetical protein
MQLQAAGLGTEAAGKPFEQGLQSGQLGLQKDKFAFNPKGTPFWQDLLLKGVEVGGKAATGGV